ncbi:MAG TPA: ADP-ribosylation factor-like protein [Deltaproteobacteria bacterium]|nr:ADP-ribosylation factor-like protein [Deltaproteobacteria bacterium]HQI82373.1 ADP-ribosylation factor-like protein [Deltaproteobacteria bacterium]
MREAQRKKICILGAAAVGKTSLMAGYSGQAVSGDYASTLGVRITRAVVPVRGRLRELIVWDIKGESAFYRIPPEYLLGAHGCVYVADGTRRGTLERALDIRARMREIIGDIPELMLVNKLDLRDIWEVDEDQLSSLNSMGLAVHAVSAHGGLALHTAMEGLARAMWGVT